MPMTHTAAVVSRVAWGIISLAVVSGCGGQAPGSEGSGPTGPDTTPPAIQSRYPAGEATLVPPNTIIAVTFTEALDTKTIIAANASLTQALVGTVQHTLDWDADSHTLKILPATNLREDTHYTVTLTDGLKDPAGHQLAPTTWSFTTGQTFDDEAPVWSLDPHFTVSAMRFDTAVVSWWGADAGEAAAVDRPSGSSGSLIYTVLYKRSTDPEFFKQNSPLGASGLTITGLKARDLYQFEIQVSDLAGNVSRYPDTIGAATMPPAGRLYAANFITGAVSAVPDVGQAAGNKDAVVVSADQTGLTMPVAIAVDHVKRLVYVADYGSNSLAAYPLGLGQYGIGHNTIPDWRIKGNLDLSPSITELLGPGALWLDPPPADPSSARYLYVANSFPKCVPPSCVGTIAVFDVNSTIQGSDQSPTTVIQRPSFRTPLAFAIDYGRQLLYVADRDAEIGDREGAKIDVYGFRGPNDVDANPRRSFWGILDTCQITDPNGDRQSLCGPTGMALDVDNDRLYLVNRGRHNILVFSKVSEDATLGSKAPAVVPIRTADGNPDTARPVGIALDPDPLTRRLYVTTDVDQSLLIFDADRVALGGEVPPLRVIKGGRTMLGQPSKQLQTAGPFSVSLAGTEAYVATPGTISVAGYPPFPSLSVFDVRSSLDPAVGSLSRVTNTPPSRVLVNPLQGAAGSAVDPANDRLYVSGFHSNMILVYENASTLTDGRRDPDRIIAGPRTMLDHPVNLLFVPPYSDDPPLVAPAVTRTGWLYVVNQTGHSVAVFDERFDDPDGVGGDPPVPMLTGDVAPARYLGPPDGTNPFSTANTPQMVYPTGIALDRANDILYVSNRDAAELEDLKGRRIVAFAGARSATGNVAPRWVLEGPVDLTTLWRPSGLWLVEDPVDDGVAGDRLFVANRGNKTVLVFQGLSAIVSAATAPADRAPTWAIFSSLVQPIGLAFNPAVNELYVSDAGNNSIQALNVGGLAAGVPSLSIAPRVIFGDLTGLIAPYGLALDPGR